MNKDSDCNLKSMKKLSPKQTLHQSLSNEMKIDANHLNEYHRLSNEQDDLQLKQNFQKELAKKRLTEIPNESTIIVTIILRS